MKAKNFLYITLLSGIAAMAGVSGAQAAVNAAKLTVSPKQHIGKCPAKFIFKGSIRSTRAGRVQYRFLRSDGAVAPVRTLHFSSPGVKRVSTSWTLGPRGRFTGWQAIQVIYPNRIVSNRAFFKLSCLKKPVLRRKPDLKITRLKVLRIGACKKYSPVVTFRATIKNVGNGTSPAVNNVALVNVMSQSVNGWGNGAKVAGPIPPGASRTVDIPVYYLISNPNAMKGAVVFYAHADRQKRVAESNERNNIGPRIKVRTRCSR